MEQSQGPAAQERVLGQTKLCMSISAAQHADMLQYVLAQEKVIAVQQRVMISPGNSLSHMSSRWTVNFAFVRRQSSSLWQWSSSLVLHTAVVTPLHCHNSSQQSLMWCHHMLPEQVVRVSVITAAVYPMLHDMPLSAQFIGINLNREYMSLDLILCSHASVFQANVLSI